LIVFLVKDEKYSQQLNALQQKAKNADEHRIQIIYSPMKQVKP